MFLASARSWQISLSELLAVLGELAHLWLYQEFHLPWERQGGLVVA